uniref:Uncharacterized protein n=1 Tax=Lactuca sativa TaxID=4236 RepID=A0A9R1VFS8_LACSA|nr:hypothetical protein LSAT_V11C500249730 [Lactuca sativa]
MSTFENASHGKTTDVHYKSREMKGAPQLFFMTPVCTLEYVLCRGLRVLLAPSQWKSNKENRHLIWVFVFDRRFKGTGSGVRSGDVMLIMKADLEGYWSPSRGNEVTRSGLMIAKLSCSKTS